MKGKSILGSPVSSFATSQILQVGGG